MWSRAVCMRPPRAALGPARSCDTSTDDDSVVRRVVGTIRYLILRHSHILSHTLLLTLSSEDDSRNEDNSGEGTDLGKGNLKGNAAETLEIVFLVARYRHPYSSTQPTERPLAQSMASSVLDSPSPSPSPSRGPTLTAAARRHCDIRSPSSSPGSLTNSSA